ncbi:MAG: alpha/beta hydrolase-fold protein [Gemmatimonadota bacterium]
MSILVRTAHRLVLALAVLLLPLVARPVGGQTLKPRTYPAEGISSFSFDSPSMGVRYDVYVWMPPGVSADASTKLPLLVVTDGATAFEAAVVAARSLVGQGAIDNLILASIGAPPEDGEAAFTKRRVYEFSPPDWDMKDPFGKMVGGLCAQLGSAPGSCTGGARRFLQAINTELIPLIARSFPVDTAQLGLFGVSAGGFFASYVIFEPESRFTRYIISSPAMAYGDDAVFRREARYAETHKDLRAGIYLASGTLEMNDPILEGLGHIASGQIRLGAMLTSRKYPGLTVQSDILQGMGHGDGAGTTLVRGMRLLYAKH